MPAWFLLRSQWRGRRRRQVAVGAVLAVGILFLLLSGMFLSGARQEIIRPLHDTISGDARITQGVPDLAGGLEWKDSRPVEEAVRTLPGAVAAPRWEASQVTARRDKLDNWTGGLLIGIDPSIPEEQAELAKYLVWGSLIPVQSVADPATNRVYVPLLVGESAAKRLDLHPGPGGGPNFTEILRLTSGRFANGASAPPIDREAVVVGVYRTGLDVLDRFTAFAPLDQARFLVGGMPGFPTANAVVVHGATADQVRALGLANVHIADASGVASQTMGIVLLAVGISSALVLGVLAFVLSLLLVREVGLQVARDAPALAALRAIGVPARTAAAGYAGLAVLTVAAAAVAAVLVATLVALFAPALTVAAAGVHLQIPWRLDPLSLGLAVAAALVLAAVASLASLRRTRRATAADQLRSA